MALTKKTKIWLIILAIPVLLLGGLVVALKLYFTPEKLKSLIIPPIEEATGTKATIDDISLAVFPSIGVDVRGLTLANKPGFSGQPYVSIERMLVDVKLRPLFDRRVEVSSLLIDKPRIFLETLENGQANFKDKTQAQTGDPAAEAGGESSVAAILLSDLQIKSGHIEVLNKLKNARQVYEGFHMTASVDVQPAQRAMTINSKTAIDKYSYGTVSTPLISDWRMNVEGDIAVDLAKSLAAITNGKGWVNAIPMSVGGTIDFKDTLRFDLAIEAKDVNVAQLLNLTPKAYVERIKGVEGKGLVQANILVKGIYDGDRDILPDIIGSINSTDASIQFPGIPKPITNINIVSDFVRSIRQQEFNIRKLTANLGQNPVSLTMNVVNFDDPALNMALNASMNLAEIKQYYPLESGTVLSGQMKANVNISGKTANPDALKASGSADFTNVTIATAGSKNPVRDLNGSLTFSNQVLESKKLSMMIGQSDLSMSFAVRNYLSMMGGAKKGPKATATASLNSTNLYWSDIAADDKATAEQGEKKPAQQGSKAAMPLPDVEMDVNANIGTLVTQKLTMKNVRGNIRVANGVIDMRNLNMSLFDGAVNSKGTLNLRNPERPTFDLTLDMNSLKANPALSMFTSFGQRLFGDMNMNIAISGALNDTLGLIPSSLNATGKVALNNGKLQGVKVNQQVASLVGVGDLSEINFKDWANAFAIKDGRAIIPDLKITALGADYTITGSQGLDGSLDCKMSSLLSEAASAKVSVPGFVGEALNALKEPDGRVRLDFNIGGTMDNPKVALDSQALQSRAAAYAQSKLDAEKAKLQQKLADEAKKKEEELKKKGEDLLKGLFKKK